MKRRLFLISILASLALTGCDALDAFFDDTPSVPDDSKKEPAEPTDDKDVPATLKSISVEGTLTKTQYYVDQDWSSEGLSVKGVYSNNDEKTLDSKDYQFTFSPSKPALDVTEVSVIAKSANGDLTSEEKKYSVEVFERIPVDKEITSIVIEETLTKTEYKENDNWDPAGLKVKANYNDSTSSYLSNEDYIFIFNPTKAFKNTTSVSIKAKLNNSNIESATRNFVVSVQEAVEYTISYNSNGGSGTMEPTVGEDPEVAACGFTAPSNKKFDHWNTSSSDIGTTYNVGAKPKANVSLYAIWVEDSSGDYYSSITATSGTALLGQLHDLSVTKHTHYNSYSGEINTTNVMKTDPYQDSIYVMDFYSGAPTKNEVVSSGDTGWNREHVWCQDLSNDLYGKTGAGADIQHIRPTIPKLNSDRGNKLYGELNNSGTPSTSKDAYGNTVQGGYYSGNVFQPMNNKKGDCARIVMYLYMHYNKASNVGGKTDGSASTGDLDFNFVIEAASESAAIQLLLTWNASDPVDEIERTRNEEAAKITGCRNPFIDNQNYPNMIWGNN